MYGVIGKIQFSFALHNFHDNCLVPYKDIFI